MTRPAWLAGAVAVSGTLAVLSAPWAIDAAWLNFLFKPLTTALIIVYAWGRGRRQPGLRRWVLVGLGLSLVGDVALMWPQGFLLGLGGFLLAHLAYLWAFTREQRFAASPWPFVGYTVLAAVVLVKLWPGVPAALRGPVLAYVACVVSMAAQSAVVAIVARGTPAAARGRGLALGGALFLGSDMLLAINRFAAPLPLSGLWILLTYWLGQWLIASWLADD